MAEFTTCRAAYPSRRLLLLCHGECRHWFDFPAHGMSRERVRKKTVSRVLEAPGDGSGDGGGRQPAAGAVDRGSEEAVDRGAGQDHGAPRRTAPRIAPSLFGAARRLASTTTGAVSIVPSSVSTRVQPS